MRPTENIAQSFETERLLIRCPRPGDGPELNAAVNESLPELHPWMEWAQSTPTVEESEENVRRAREAFLAGTDLRLLLFLKGTDTLVGSSGLHDVNREIPSFGIGYWCRTRFSGRGYITEAVRGIAAFALDALGANRVFITCDSRNRKSARVAERAGFRLEGELRNHRRSPDGTLSNTLFYAVTPEDRLALGAQAWASSSS
jgi:RimJ/RimL family protein N-acetyltransferase